MSIRTLVIACAASLALAAGAASAQTTMHSPAKVKKALGTLNRVVDHTQRLMTAKNYTRLPHENDEFKEATGALEKGIAKEPDDFKSKVEPLLQKAEADSQNVADAASAHDDAKLATAHDALADSVKAVLAAFPDSVQPPSPSKAKEKQEDKAAQ